jgi:hypothetical protein
VLLLEVHILFVVNVVKVVNRRMNEKIDSTLGFSIGKEGPLVHICSIICNQLTRLPQFKRIRHVQ